MLGVERDQWAPRNCAQFVLASIFHSEKFGSAQVQLGSALIQLGSAHWQVQPVEPLLNLTHELVRELDFFNLFGSF